MEPWCKPQKHRNKPGSGITELVTSSRPRRILDPSQVRTYHRLYWSFDAGKLGLVGSHTDSDAFSCKSPSSKA